MIIFRCLNNGKDTIFTKSKTIRQNFDIFCIGSKNMLNNVSQFVANTS